MAVDDENYSHLAVLEKAQGLLEVLLQDPFLLDVAENCILNNLKSQLALMQGKAITVHINKFDGGVICE